MYTFYHNDATITEMFHRILTAISLRDVYLTEIDFLSPGWIWSADLMMVFPQTTHYMA